MHVKLKSIFTVIAIIGLILIDHKFRNFPKGHVICLLSDRPMSWVILLLLATVALWCHFKNHPALRNLAIIGMIIVFF